ncbi:MAG: hypothetical protein J2P25_14910 [Nocardiopsaceae bacterium]|nr:hypothetical protein [Nocardiopsaceae bacterium]
MTIGTGARRRRRSRPAPQDRRPAEMPSGQCGAMGRRLRRAGERLRGFLDPPDTGRDPGALTRLLESLRAFTRTRARETDGAIAFAIFAVSLLGDRLARSSVSAGCSRS